MAGKFKKYFKILLYSSLPSFLLFAFLYFPYSDIGNLVSAKISEFSGNQVLFQFDKMNLSVIPTPGLQFDQVNIDSNFVPRLKMDSLSIHPSISGLISFKPGVNVESEGFLGGNLQLVTKGADKTEKGTLKQQINLDGQNMSVDTISDDFSIPLSLGGRLDLSLEAVVDPSFIEQPDGKLDLNIKNFIIKGGAIDTGVMGSINLPPLDAKQMTLQGTLSQGRLKLEKLIIGSATDEVKIDIKGSIAIRLRAMGPTVSPQPGAYNLEVDIDASKEFEDKFGLYLGFIEQFKVKFGQRSRYRFKLSALNLGLPPKMESF